jgi:hypothetical protein
MLKSVIRIGEFIKTVHTDVSKDARDCKYQLLKIWVIGQVRIG